LYRTAIINTSGIFPEKDPGNGSAGINGKSVSGRRCENKNPETDNFYLFPGFSFFLTVLFYPFFGKVTVRGDGDRLFKMSYNICYVTLGGDEPARRVFMRYRQYRN
jgi:hypothetical protein